MLEKLIKGRYLTFSYPVPKITYELGAFVTQPTVAFTIDQSVHEKLQVPKWDSKGDAFVREGPQNQQKLVSQKQRVSSVSAGENTDKAHRNFQWLRYYGGAVNQVTFDNLDVLSGDFSGCWMVVYKKAGIEYVGHVGTVDSADNIRSIKAKEAWNEFAENNQRDVLRGFSPAKAWPIKPKKIDGDGVARIWGLVTKSELVSIFLYRQDKDWNRFRIADWKVVDPSFVPQLYQI